MMDYISSDKGWSLEYCEELTYWQVLTLWERLWERRGLDIHIAVKLNPFAGGGGGTEGAETIDATNDDAWEKLRLAGLPIKNSVN